MEDRSWIELFLIPLIALFTGTGFVGWYLQSKIETFRREKEKLQVEWKEIYIEIFDPYIRMFAGINNPSETRKALNKITSYDYRRVLFKLNLLGSDDVVRALTELMQYFYSVEKLEDGTSPDPKDMLDHFGAVLLAIRRDLGNKRTKLTEIDMLRIQIKDIDQLITGSGQGQ